MAESDRELDLYLNSQLGAVHCLEHLSRDVLASGGKRLRARLTLKLCEHLGVEREQALPWAAANEMLHNASLVHDDIQDRDLYRRGKPTLWSSHGTEVAISVGDYLLMKPFLIAGQIPVCEKLRFQLQQWIAETVARMAIAQVAERQLISHIGNSGEELRIRYLQVVDGKTSSLFELPVQGVALLAGQSAAEREQARQAFALLGQYFQIVDDLKDIFGRKDKPEPGADLREGKVSALVASYLTLKSNRAEELHAFLTLPEASKTNDEIRDWCQEFETAGAIEKTLNWAETTWRLFATSLPAKLSHPALIETLQLWLEFKREPQAGDQVCLSKQW